MQEVRNYDVMSESSAKSGDAMPIFKLVAIQNNAKTLEKGHAVFDDIEHVEIRIPGDPKNIVTAKVNDQHKERWPEEYKKWKATRENTVSGTPLETWPLLTPSQVMQLKVSNIFTIEQLAELSDTAKQNYGMGIGELQTKAQAYLGQSKDTAYAQKIAKDLDDANERIAMLEKQIAELAQSDKPTIQKKKQTKK